MNRKKIFIYPLLSVLLIGAFTYVPKNEENVNDNIVVADASIEYFESPDYAARKTGKPETITLDLRTAQSLAVANSDKIEKLLVRIQMKEASVAQAIKSVQLKEKNMKSFRWSPLLGFHFPEQPDMAEAFEFKFKPTQLRYELTTLKHELNETTLNEERTISEYFITIYTTEKTVEFDKERLRVTEGMISETEPRVISGDANQADLDSMISKKKDLEKAIAAGEKTLSSTKAKLSSKIGMDVSTNVVFASPYIDGDLGRDKIEFLQDYTLENDHTYYQAKIDTFVSYQSLVTENSLMKNHYGSEINGIESYVTTSMAGGKVSALAFKNSYDSFLKQIDSHWTGSKRIIFWKIPREWFKGELDGTRYITDEPYCLYESSLEYYELNLEKINLENELKDQVNDMYENYINAKNSYISSVEMVEKEKKLLEAAKTLNLIGEMSYDEYSSQLDSYESAQTSMIKNLSSYSDLYYEYNRLTCRGLSEVLDGSADADLYSGEGGDSYVVEEDVGNAMYFIDPIVEDEQFRFCVYIPDDAGFNATSYELWCDGIQIGDRTPIDDEIRHLVLAIASEDNCFVRLYDGDKVVDDIDIDPYTFSGYLEVHTFHVKDNYTEIGAYKTSTNEMTDTVKLGITAYNPDAASYRICDSTGKYLLGEDYVPVNGEFIYMGFLLDDLDTVMIEFYDAGNALLETGTFNIEENVIEELE